MTLHILPDVVQGSDEWLEHRRGILTASTIGQLVTPSTLKPANNPHTRAIVAQLAAERITGWVEPSYVSDDMLRGAEDEARAVQAYEQHKGVDVDLIGFMTRDEAWGRLGYSPDGLVGGDGLIEVKSRRPKKHLSTVVANSVPAENYAQIQAGLLVSGRDWCDYISYSGGMHLWVKRVHPDPAWFDAIAKAVTAFEQAVERMVDSYHKAVEGLPLTERTIEQEMVI